MEEVTLEQAPQAVKDLFNKGFSAFERGNLDYAIDMLMHCVEIEPGFLRGRKFLRAAQVQRAKRLKMGALGKILNHVTGLPLMLKAGLLAQSGKVFLEMEDWDNAERALQEASTADPDNGDYMASLAWAIYRNPKYTGSQAMQNKAKQMLNKAITMERSAQAFTYKGWMLLEAGQESMAEAEFNKALKLDARHTMARRGLRTLQEQQEQQKKGLFKRMFK